MASPSSLCADLRGARAAPALPSQISSSSSSAVAFPLRARIGGSLSVSSSSIGRRDLGIGKCSSAGEAANVDVEQVPIEKRFEEFPSVLDINKIRDILPHRYPFLLVDRVIEYQPGVTAVGIKNVTINDNFFPGHFPERPIMPGVLMVEAMAQVGGLVMLKPEAGGSKEIFFFAGVDKVRFRKPVIAGDTLVMRMNLVKFQKRFGIVKMEGKAYVGKNVVCEGEFTLAMASSDDEATSN
ncbi:uncharacterized protein LOC9661564 [Selaginella moellendorffii]|nr:uncharacterized protein LOC9661564 [Selaginella moellendorffii]|eukprot:XP_002992379.2 uncharacterized protein LOC9661564 [Selaginella moellendorffii]